MIAGYAAGVFGDITEALRESVVPDIRIDPAPGENKKYERYVEIYEELFKALRDVYKKISS
jgi:sugar (pentulose or hexulose) kinase